jgi:hypothetical protein
MEPKKDERRTKIKPHGGSVLPNYRVAAAAVAVVVFGGVLEVPLLRA